MDGVRGKDLDRLTGAGAALSLPPSAVSLLRPEHAGLDLDRPVRWLGWFAFPILLFSLPNTWGLAGLGMAPESLVALGVVLLMVIDDCALSGGRQMLSALRSVPLSIYVLLCVLFISRGLLAHPVKLTGVFRLGLWGTVLFLGVLTARDARRLRSFFRIWSGLAIGAAAVYLAQPGRWGALRVDLLAWEHRTTFSFFLVVPAMIHCSRLLDAPEDRRRMADAVAAAILIGAVLLAQSRGPWLVLYTALFIHASLHARRRRATLTLLLVVLGVLVFLAITTDSDMATRLRGSWDFEVRSSAPYRLDLYQAAVRSIPDVGWFGAGPGSAGAILNAHTQIEYPHLVMGEFNTDSDMIWLLVEAGPLAAISLLASLVWWARRLIGERSALSRARGDGAGIVCLFMMLTGLIFFDNALSSPLGWYLLGIGVGAMSLWPRRARQAGGAA